MTFYTDEQIARVVHEATRALQHAHADPSPADPWDAFPRDRQLVTIEGVRRARAGATARELHEFWRQNMTAKGWRYGPVKDYEQATHPCLVPYEDLPPSQRDKDSLFQQIVLSMSILSVSA